MADELDDLLDDGEEKKSNKVVIVFVTTLIVLIWLAIFVLLIKLDIGGFGSNVLRPVLKDVPVLNMILPEASDEEVGLDSEYPYTTLAEAIERIKELEEENFTLREAAATNAEKIAELTVEVERLSEFEEYQKEFEELRRAYDEEVVFGEHAITEDEYKLYYETISPDNAADIYEMVLERRAYQDVIQALSDTYAKMDPDKAATILEEMTGDMQIVATLLAAMKEANAAEILANMDPTYAGKITLLIYPTVKK